MISADRGTTLNPVVIAGDLKATGGDGEGLFQIADEANGGTYYLVRPAGTSSTSYETNELAESYLRQGEAIGVVFPLRRIGERLEQTGGKSHAVECGLRFAAGLSTGAAWSWWFCSAAWHPARPQQPACEDWAGRGHFPGRDVAPVGPRFSEYGTARQEQPIRAAFPQLAPG